MINTLDIYNFRSIREQHIALKKLNILYGPNGSGKSSVMYAPYVLRNFYRNPNQQLDSLFNLGFINLGGLENVKGNERNVVGIGFRQDMPKESNNKLVLPAATFDYWLELDNKLKGGKLFFEFGPDLRGAIAIDFPYTLTRRYELAYKNRRLLWNGITFEAINSIGFDVATVLNTALESVKNIELISVKRGFFNPIFSTDQPSEESQFALGIRNQTDFESKIDHYFRKVFDKTFRFIAIPGSTSFYLRTQNSKGRTIDLVNEGFGVNQTIYMLINLLKKTTSLAFIEEPEIHLHPSAQNKLMDVFVEIIQNENKQIFLSTHSENIVTSVLSKISKGELDVNDVQFYLAKNENDETVILPQTVNSKGQVEGGLLSFMETELENLRSLLGLKNE